MQRNRRYNRRPENRFEGQERKLLFFFRSRFFDYGQVVQHDAEAPRMSGMENLRDLNADGTAQPVARLGFHSRMDRLAASRETQRSREAKWADKQAGLRLDVLLVAMMVLAFTLGTAWLIDRSRLNDCGKNITAKEKQIRTVSAQIEALEQEYADAVSNTDMVRIAVEQLGMISTKGSNRVYLTVPADALQGAMEITDSMTIGQLAAIQGD